MTATCTPPTSSPSAPASRASPRSAAVTPAGRSSATRPGSNASRRHRPSSTGSSAPSGGALVRSGRCRPTAAWPSSPCRPRRPTAPRRRAAHARSRRRPTAGRRPGPCGQLARGDRRRWSRPGGHRRPRRCDGRGDGQPDPARLPGDLRGERRRPAAFPHRDVHAGPRTEREVSSIIPEHVYVNGDGELDVGDDQLRRSLRGRRRVPLRSTDDVADFAFSGNEPISYPVPEAVFP